VAPWLLDDDFGGDLPELFALGALAALRPSFGIGSIDWIFRDLLPTPARSRTSSSCSLQIIEFQ